MNASPDDFLVYHPESSKFLGVLKSQDEDTHVMTMVGNGDDVRTAVRDALIRTFEDILNDLMEKYGEHRTECPECPVLVILSQFTVKLRKAGLQEEAEIVRAVREKYNI